MTRSRTTRRARDAGDSEGDSADQGLGPGRTPLDDDSADIADNEQTKVLFTRNDMSMGNAGRRSTRKIQTTAKKSRRSGRTVKESDEEPLSAGEMDE